MRRESAILALLIIVALVMSTAVNAGVPGMINYQGHLTHSGGDPVSDNVDMHFAVYDALSGGSSLWSESHVGVTVDSGMFSVVLGSTTAIPVTVFDNEELWLQITVGGEVIDPRTRLVAAPYAHRASSVYGFTPGPDNSISGSYVFVAGDSNTAVGDYVCITGGFSNYAERGESPDTMMFDTSMVGDPGFSRPKLMPEAFPPPDPCFWPRGPVPAWLGGGRWNAAVGMGSGVAAGGRNSALAGYAFIGGGASNWVRTMASFIGGGYNNQIQGPGVASVIAGGYSNLNFGVVNTISGGGFNEIPPGPFLGCVIGGGWRNQATNYLATIGGGQMNVAGGFGSTVSGGGFGTSNGNYSAVLGGFANSAAGDYSSAVGGSTNQAAGNYATVAGGANNSAAASYSFAAGHNASVAGVDNGTFLWADDGGGVFMSQAANEFAIRAENGVRFASDAGPAKVISIGQNYRDNGLVAWAKVLAGGGIGGAGNAQFGVTAVIPRGAGWYEIEIDAAPAGEELLIPVAIADMYEQPVGAAALRILSVGQVTGFNNTFFVYVNDGLGNPVDNDFVFMVTAR